MVDIWKAYFAKLISTGNIKFALSKMFFSVCKSCGKIGIGLKEIHID